MLTLINARRDFIAVCPPSGPGPRVGLIEKNQRAGRCDQPSDPREEKSYGLIEPRARQCAGPGLAALNQLACPSRHFWTLGQKFGDRTSGPIKRRPTMSKRKNRWPGRAARPRPTRREIWENEHRRRDSKSAPYDALEPASQPQVGPLPRRVLPRHAAHSVLRKETTMTFDRSSSRARVPTPTVWPSVPKTMRARDRTMTR